MKIIFKLQGFQFKRAEFTETFVKTLRLEMRNAAREFAKEAILRVPVRTGFARGALLNLNDAIGLNAASNPASFRARLRKRKAKSSAANGQLEYYTDGGSKVLKTPDNARQFSTSMDRVFLDDGRKFTFNYEVTVLYYEINDVVSNPRTPSSPWKSFVEGRKAFLKYLKDVGLKRLPAVTNYLVKAQIR